MPADPLTILLRAAHRALDHALASGDEERIARARAYLRRLEKGDE